MTTKKFKSGFVAVVGKPNVGKSSLINALVGEKVAITSPKPQTTRNKILGIVNKPDFQMIFVDTPGEYNAKSKLAQFMQKSIGVAQEGVDAIAIVLDAGRINQADFKIIERYKSATVPVFVIINKIDLASFEALYPTLARLNEYTFVKEFISVSALKKKNIDAVLDKISAVLPEGQPLFDVDDYTDKSVRFMTAEIIREKVLLFVQQEIPHFCAVEIMDFKEDDKKVKIAADIICENDRHKTIIVGKNGEMIKKIGTSARQDIEKLVGKTVFLELFVKIREGWQSNSSVLADLGYDIDTL